MGSRWNLRRVYRYIPSQKWDSMSILYTSWWNNNIKKINHSEGAENIVFEKNLLKNKPVT